MHLSIPLSTGKSSISTSSMTPRSQRIQAIRANQEIQQVEYISLFGQ